QFSLRYCYFSLFIIRRHPSSTLFPYTTLFRSARGRIARSAQAAPTTAPRVHRLEKSFSADVPARSIARILRKIEFVDSTLWRRRDRKSTRLNSSHVSISYAVFCLKKKKKKTII